MTVAKAQIVFIVISHGSQKKGEGGDGVGNEFKWFQWPVKFVFLLK